MKIIAFYLPQFHSIPENDRWWGNGFTEWDNVRRTKSLFKGHNQPEVPIDKNYYNLLDDSVQINQSHLAKKYGVDGFCYYHYWFDGKLLLEKPMEKMLQNKNIDIPFCICWANETWARTWDGNESDILIKQNYEEGFEGWKKHFDYLLPFLLDSRYIKHNNKPMLLLYKPQLIKNLDKLMDCWNQLALKAGFSGIYWGYQHRSAFDYELDRLDFGIEFEPFFTVREIENEEKETISTGKIKFKNTIEKIHRKIHGLPIIYDYDAVWERILKRNPKHSNIMPGAFTSWDNTPRKGKDGVVFFEATPEKFGQYIRKQLIHAKTTYKADYLFINAWNEWAEGAHLEPDERFKYQYLEELYKATQHD